MEPLTEANTTDVIGALAMLVGVVVIIFKPFFFNSKKKEDNRNQEVG